MPRPTWNGISIEKNSKFIGGIRNNLLKNYGTIGKFLMSDKFENPFVGPRAFEKGEEKLFYGRETEARTLLAQVISEPLVLFYARSGVGKSSLINTCLIPSLEEEEFVVLPVGRVGGTLTNESDKIDNIFVFNLLTSLAPDDTPLNDLSNMTLSAFLKKRSKQDPLTRVVAF